MPAHQKDPLRPLTPDERRHLEHMSRSRTDSAAQVARAKELLVVADGAGFEAAASSRWSEERTTSFRFLPYLSTHSAKTVRHAETPGYTLLQCGIFAIEYLPSASISGEDDAG